MNALIIYDSIYGNTKEIAEAIADMLGQHGTTRLVPARSATVLDFTGIDLLALGGPTQWHGLSPSVEDFLERIPADKLTGLTTVVFDTRVHVSSWLSGSAAEQLGKKLRQYGVKLLLLPESFFVEGKEGPLESGETERAREWAYMVVRAVDTAQITAI
jgi:flavodoxin